MSHAQLADFARLIAPHLDALFRAAYRLTGTARTRTKSSLSRPFGGRCAAPSAAIDETWFAWTLQRPFHGIHARGPSTVDNPAVDLAPIDKQLVDRFGGL